MEIDDSLPRPGDRVDALVREDIDALSVGELESRIAALEGEIVRCRARIAHAVNHRATADALFQR